MIARASGNDDSPTVDASAEPAGDGAPEPEPAAYVIMDANGVIVDLNDVTDVTDVTDV
ncbi:MAG: hypothetical protein JWP76_4439, partial [Dactylosporangium sp.]|nr:hypothetical protein [Dactylosporangium sp.]